MASPIPKQLGELLKEQQEPFDLEDYLDERLYITNNFNSKTSFRCCSANSSRSFFKRSGGWSLTKRMKGIPTCSKIVKPLFKRLFSVRNNLRLKSCKVKRIGKGKSKRMESDRFSSASCTTVFDSCSESDTRDGDEPGFFKRDSGSSSTENISPSFRIAKPLPQEIQVVADKNVRWKWREDNKELSPVSVLEEISTEESSPDQDNIESGERKAETMDPISQNAPVSCYKYLTGIRILQLSKQFLFDFMREFVENRAREGTRQNRNVMEFPGPEQIEKILREDMRRWNKLSEKEFNITELLSSDFRDSVAEWRDYKLLIWEISSEIGDAILEEIGSEMVGEMTEVTELLGLHSCLRI